MLTKRTREAFGSAGVFALCWALMGCSPARRECEPGTEEVTDAQASLVRSIDYNAQRQALVVGFVGSDQAIEYVKVPPEVYDMLAESPSKGTFYINNIRGQFPFLCP